MKNQWVYVADNVKFIIFATENKLITLMNEMLRRKIDAFLMAWKENPASAK